MSRRAQAGFTLVEAVVAIAVLGIALSGVAFTIGFGARYQADPMLSARAAALARATLEEVLARRYDEQSPVGGVPACSPSTTPCSAAGAFDDGEARSAYDDVDDYDGLDELPPRDAEGNVRDGYTGFRVQVAVAYLDGASVTALGLDDPTDAKRVTVTVTPPNGPAVVVDAVRGNF